MVIPKLLHSILFLSKYVAYKALMLLGSNRDPCRPFREVSIAHQPGDLGRTKPILYLIQKQNKEIGGSASM
jgi:hypothetical protein